MKTFTMEEIAKAAGGRLLAGDPAAQTASIATDSRKAEPGDIFFALIGLVNDAHKYLGDVVARGCRNLVISDESKLPEGVLAEGSGCNVILVEDTTKALQDLSKYYLSLMPLKYKLAVTGSVGKTSTRDMLYAVVNTKYKAAKSIKNFNNGFGLPLTILGFPLDTEVAVLEMGMDDFGEIELLADLVRPDLAIITNIGISHMEKLGSREGIRQAKMEVTTFFDENSTLIINTDCDLLQPDEVGGVYQLKTAGTKAGNDFVVSDVCDFGEKGIKYKLTRDHKEYDVSLLVPGAHNAINATLAIAAGEKLGITVEEAMAGLQETAFTDNRLRISHVKDMTIIDDTYNACPESVKSAISTLMASEGRRHVAIIGDMYELGSESADAHRQVGAFAAAKQVDLLITVGEDAAFYAEGAAEGMDDARILYFAKKAELLEQIDRLVQAGDVILVKASRGMALEKVVQKISE